jgi:D-alanyl-D-alanine carboxypeptidase/D-alanyl-D-alanine-endopeptidase (penicillin-binding protein 4)
MRRLAATLGVMLAVLGAASAANSATKSKAAKTPQTILSSSLAQGMRQGGGASGAYVLDLTTGQSLFAASLDIGRLPASIEKLYATSTALLRYGPNANLTTSVFGQGTLDAEGRWRGTLYLKGGGDPTFGSASFDHFAYGGGATIQRLVANLIRATGITSIEGRLIGDESYFDSLRGTPASGFGFSTEVEGSLSALVFNRGLVNQGTAYVLHPAVFAAQQFVSALKAAHVKVAAHIPIGSGRAPADARRLAVVHSPRIATLIKLTNTPSDNFFAETLLKDLGARFGGAGTTAAGAAVVRSELSSQFGINARLNDGSGLSRSDSTTPRQVVTLLQKMASNPSFFDSLAVAGETGTLHDEMKGSVAQGRCHGKTGSLHDVANLAGYCQAADGHTLAFAFLMNALGNANAAHDVEADMAVSLARYNG